MTDDPFMKNLKIANDIANRIDAELSKKDVTPEEISMGIEMLETLARELGEIAKLLDRMDEIEIKQKNDKGTEGTG